MNKFRPREQGFTLFEVMIAMAIMASAAVLLATAWGGNQLRVKKMTINNRAAFLLERAVSDIENQYGRRFDQIPDSDGGPFEDYPGFSWEMKSQEYQFPDLRAIMVANDQGNEMGLLIVEKIKEYIDESVKEIKVTIKYTKGKRSVKYSASTLIVNFDRPLALPGFGGGGGGAPPGGPSN